MVGARRSFVTITLLLTLAGATGASADGVAAPSSTDLPPLEARLAGIEAALVRLAVAIERQDQRDQTDLWMRRLQLTMQELAPLEGEVRNSRSALERARRDRQRLQERLARAEAQLERIESQGGDLGERNELESQLEQIQAALAAQREDLRDAEARLSEAESAAADLRSERDRLRLDLDRRLAKAER